VVGKHAEGWGADDADVALFRDRIVAPANPASAGPLRKSGADSAGRALSDLDRLMLRPIRADLDRMGPMALPVLITGAPGTGRSRAAQFLHQASGSPVAAEMRRIFGAEIDLQFCVEIARPGKVGKRNRVRDTILIEGVDNVPAAIQPQLARSIEEGIFNAGPRIIAISDGDGVGTTASTTAGLAPELRSALGALTIRLPRFSDRAEDVADIASALLPILAARMNLEVPGLDDRARRTIADHAWPGNLHEMRSVLSAALADRSNENPMSAREIETRIPPSAKAGVAAPLADLVDMAMEAPMFSLPDFERSIYLAALERADGNLSAAARMLGVTRAQFAYRINAQGEPGQEKRVRSVQVATQDD
jgi:DNA-binding NtrC family response regulator